MKTQKGFGIVPILLILVLVAAISFTGYYVYDKQSAKSSNKSKVAGDTTAKASPAPTVVSTTNATTTPTVPSAQVASNNIYDGWLTHTSKYEKFSFSYPKGWTIKENYDGFKEQVVLSSPNRFELAYDLYKLDSAVPGDCTSIPF